MKLLANVKYIHLASTWIFIWLTKNIPTAQALQIAKDRLL